MKKKFIKLSLVIVVIYVISILTIPVNYAFARDNVYVGELGDPDYLSLRCREMSLYESDDDKIGSDDPAPCRGTIIFPDDRSGTTLLPNFENEVSIEYNENGSGGTLSFGNTLTIQVRMKFIPLPESMWQERIALSEWPESQAGWDGTHKYTYYHGDLNFTLYYPTETGWGTIKGAGNLRDDNGGIISKNQPT